MTVFIAAEAGVNHLGDRSKMLALCDAAKRAGASAVKFQAYNSEALVKRRGKGDLALLKQCELTDDDFRAIAKHCIDLGLRWFASVFDESQVPRLEQWSPWGYKISHVESSDKALINRAWKTGRPVFASATCHADAKWDEMTAHKVFCPRGYPATDGFLAHLSTYGWDGLSSHYADYRKPAAACVGREDFYLECHLRLSDTDPEAAWSLSPEDFGKMVKLIREYETWL